MPSVATFIDWAESLPQLSYYAILQVKEDATLADIKAAFHSFAMRCHPDRYIDDDPDLAKAAAEVFKRGVEAYNILSKPDLRAKYDKGLPRKLRYDPDALPSVPPPPPKGRTLEEVANTPKGKKFATQADRLISIGKLEDARIQLINATQEEPFNDELKERLGVLYEALCLEPL